MRNRVYRILVIDADADDRLILDDLLGDIELWDAEVTWADSYEQGVRCMAEGPFDVALVDYRLGARRGVEFVGEPVVRSEGLPVVILTGQGGSEADLAAGDAGAADFLPKQDLDATLLERTIRYTVEEHRRHRTEARFRALVESSRDLTTILDAQGLLEYATPSLRHVLGYDPEEMLGRDLVDLVHEADRKRVRAELDDLIARPGASVHSRYRIHHRDGSLRTFDSVGQNKLADPLIRGVVISSWDVTELQEVRQRTRFQGRLLDAVGQSVIATDLEGTIIYWNRAAEELFGWSREEALGRSVVEMTPAEGARERAIEIFDVLREGHVWTGEFELRRRDGSTFHALVTDAPIYDGEGELIGVIGVSSDVSERHALEEQLRQSQKMEAVGRLAGGIAHDFNNILTAIGGHCELLLEDMPEGPHRTDVQDIARSAKRAAALTRQLLAFSRKQVMETRSLDLGAAVADMQPMLRRLVPERIALDVAAADGCIVRADRSQLGQVLLNLVVNAADAIQGAGTIEVVVDRVVLSSADAAALPWAVEPGAYARLEVRDTGYGMSEDVLEHVFEPFYTTKPEGRGTGLGLSTVYGIVKQSAGHVFVDSEPGRGTRFRVLLPEQQEGPEPARPLEPPSSPAPGGVVLLVEDDDAVRSLTRRVLTRAGFEVLEASNGREALERLDQHPGAIDLVLSDVVMPDMGGAELADRLRERRPGLSVVLTSGYSEAELRGEVRDRASAFLVKPFTPEALVRVVSETLADSRPGPSKG